MCRHDLPFVANWAASIRLPLAAEGSHACDSDVSETGSVTGRLTGSEPRAEAPRRESRLRNLNRDGPRAAHARANRSRAHGADGSEGALRRALRWIGTIAMPRSFNAPARVGEANVRPADSRGEST
jgi:hypothetical protein